uniref:Ig-like domain-containing protein n=1 Tax=Salmo trutta TaxID=8032 RepID=A0A674F558_SALTR
MEGSSVTLYCNYSGSVYYLQWYRQYPRSCHVINNVYFNKKLLNVHLFTFAGDTYEQTIEPNQHKVYAEMGSNVLLSCNYSSAYSLLWYKQSPGSAPQNLLLILDSTGTEHRADSLDSRFSGKQNKEKTRLDLEISSVDVTDSALYYCALNPTVTGNPETLYKNLTSPERVFLLSTNLHHFKDKLLVNLTTLSNFKKDINFTRNTTQPFSKQLDASQKPKTQLNEALTFDDLHQMTLLGHYVTQYMYVLLDNVHIYIQKQHFTLAHNVEKCFPSKPSDESAQ